MAGVKDLIVDFEFKREPAYTVAAIRYVGPFRENHLRKEFKELVSWANKAKVPTGKWIFREIDGPFSRRPDNQRRWEACLVIRGKARGQGRIRIKKIPASTVARVVFDPDKVSARVVYHGLNDWLRWRKKDKTIKGIGPTREVYAGDPWTNARAWSRAEVQYLVRK